MFRTVSLICALVLLAALSGPFAYAASNLSRTDPSDVYIIVGFKHDLNSALEHDDVREVGPYRPLLARMVQVPEATHVWLVEKGFWVFPATALAKLCAVDQLG